MFEDVLLRQCLEKIAHTMHFTNMKLARVITIKAIRTEQITIDHVVLPRIRDVRRMANDKGFKIKYEAFRYLYCIFSENTRLFGHCADLVCKFYNQEAKQIKLKISEKELLKNVFIKEENVLNGFKQLVNTINKRVKCCSIICINDMLFGYNCFASKYERNGTIRIHYSSIKYEINAAGELEQCSLAINCFKEHLGYTVEETEFELRRHPLSLQNQEEQSHQHEDDNNELMRSDSDSESDGDGDSSDSSTESSHWNKPIVAKDWNSKNWNSNDSDTDSESESESSHWYKPIIFK